LKRPAPEAAQDFKETIVLTDWGRGRARPNGRCRTYRAWGVRVGIETRARLEARFLSGWPGSDPAHECGLIMGPEHIDFCIFGYEPLNHGRFAEVSVVQLL